MTTVDSSPTTITLTLDGQSCTETPGRTVLDVARDRGIEIPTLCHDPRLKPDASCSVCVVEVQQGGQWKVQPSCALVATPGMVVRTRSDAVRRARKWAIELLLSDHYADCVAPCVIKCPAHVDVPEYLRAVREGRPADAVEIVRRTNPLPAICGRVCPHDCEDVCHRGVVDAPIAINLLKRAATEVTLADAAGSTSAGSDSATALGETSGKHVAVVGAGPAGLTAAHFLRIKGHGVTVFDAQTQAGGMLRYGIPEYRLPRDVLQADLDRIAAMGVEFRFEKRLGRDFTLDSLLSSSFDAVFLAIGAWKGRDLRVPNEHADGVMGGVPFLRKVNRHALERIEGRVGVIGGGNTALDAARASMRLGAARVTVYYRREQGHMPAFREEIEAALEEGIELECLVAPVAIEAEKGRAVGITLQRMRMSESDASGRPRPVPIEGTEHTVPVELVIKAIGEIPDLGSLGTPESAKTRGIANLIDSGTWATAARGVFAGGDFVTGPSSVIEAIAAGRRAATSIDQFLRTGAATRAAVPIYSSRERLDGAVREDFNDHAEAPRAPLDERAGADRARDFDEVSCGLTLGAAQTEADRCMQCTCSTFATCDLRALMDAHQAEPGRVHGKVHHYAPEALRVGIRLEMNKCVRCARCVRICHDLATVGAIEFIHRGFGTRLIFAPTPTRAAFDACDRCLAEGALCVDTCPTGALTIVDGKAKLVAPNTGPYTAAETGPD